MGLPLLSKTGNAVNGNESQELPVSATLPISEGIDTDFSLDKEFPTVSLSEPAARDIINNLTTPDAAVSNFVDPYEFEDQLILISMKHDGMNLQEETLIYTVWCSIVNLMMWWVDGQSTHTLQNYRVCL